ncbi:uncharacterized protein LOC111249912 isoform X6 [Varroa destructor]|uniref:Uncharacterized protein n=1 Tax=Varroa destructor TaxID=109461 RepID=A0A7M7M9N4_VARDE|nr:uncharacterized protein LOC111249912 isoform X6 [Varroa destructor]
MHRYRHGRRRLRKRTHNRRNLLEVVKGALPCVACSLKTGRATEYRTGYSRLGGTLKEKSYLPEMAPIESPVAPPTFGSFGRSTGSRLRATSLARFHRFSNGCQTWTPGMFARCGDGTCDCCPYGYHIDLDFVRFCESLKDTAGYQSYLEHLQALKRGKREQRKALEEVYACPQLLFHPRTSSPSAKDHAGSTSDVEMAKRQQLLLQHRHQQNEPHFSFNKRTRPPIPFWWLCDVASPAAGQKSPCEDPEQDLSSLTDVIQDFEGTLHSSYEDNPDTTGKTDRTGKAMCPRKGAPQRYREGSLEPILLEKRLPPDGGDSISELKLNTKLTEEQCRRHVYSEEEQRKAEQLLDMIFGDGKLVEEIEVDDADYKDGGHRRKSARNADVSKQRSDSVSSSESINTISSLNYPTSSKVKMSVLKEEKRLLKLQLKAKNNLRDGKADPGAHEPPLSSRTGMSAAGSLLSVASTSRSHPGDESSRSQSRLPTTADTIHPPPPRPSMSVQSPVGSRGPLLPKLEPLKVEELPSSTSAMSPIRPSKLEALETGVARVMRGRRSVAGGGPDETEADWSGVHESATGTSLKDELWRETMQEPKYKSDQKGISGRASNKILGDYLAKASVNPEPLIIPGYYHHTGINCCTETQSRSTPMEGAQRRTAEPESVSPLPVPLREDRAESQMKTLCDECQKDSIRLRKDPRTSATQTTAVTPRDCVECVERRKRQLRSTAVNTDVRPITPEPLRKSAKEAFILDICDGTPFTPKSTSFCAECDRRRSVRSYSVGSATETPRTRDSSCDPLPELKPVFKKTPPTPPPKPAAFTRGVAVQCSTSITVSQAVQVTPERVRTRHVGAQSDWRACQRAQGTQTRRTENERSKKLDTNSVASGDYDVRHAVCDSCAHRRLRSIGTGDVAVYDTCCNRCAVFSKCDGAVQCELLTSEASDGSVSRANHRGIQKIEMKDQEVLTDDSYCDEITELIAIPCERCDVERRDFGFGDEDVFAAETRLQVVPRALIATEEVGVMTDHSIIEPLSFPPAAAAAPGGVAAAATTAAGGTALSRTSSASSMSHLTGNVRLCDKCSCAIESVAKDFIDQNLDHLVAEVTNDPPVPTLQSRIPKLSHSRGSRAPPRRTKPAPFDSVSRSLRRDVTPSASTAAPLSIGSLDDQPILANQTPSIIPGSMERLPGEKGTSDGFDSDHCLSWDSSYIYSGDSCSGDTEEDEDEFVSVGRIICHFPLPLQHPATLLCRTDERDAVQVTTSQYTAATDNGTLVHCPFLAVDPAGSLVLCGTSGSASSSGCTGSGSSVIGHWEQQEQQQKQESPTCTNSGTAVDGDCPQGPGAACPAAETLHESAVPEMTALESPQHVYVPPGIIQVSTAATACTGWPVKTSNDDKVKRSSCELNDTTPSTATIPAWHTLTREMESACLILNEYLQRPEKSDPNKLKAAMSRIQTEWFGVTSGPETDPAHVQEILEELDKISNHLLHRVINMADNNGNTALHYAVSHGNFTVVTRLLDSRATDVNKQNRAGYTPVMLAALASLGTNEATQRAIVHRLFQMGDVNSKASQNGQTALMLAASHGRADMVKALLETGADPNTQDNDGSTALMCAAEHGYIDVVRMLLANPDVEINIADHDGQTALSIAMEAGHKDTALLIYASSNFSRGSSPYSSLRGRKSRISPRATPPPSRPSRTPPPPGPSRPSRTPPPPSPSRSRKGSTSSVSSFSRAWF